MIRRTEHVEGVALFHHHTVLHYGHAIEDLLGHIQLMRDEYDGDAKLAIDALQ